MKYISGGYYIISPAKRSQYMDKDVLPNTIFSASDCICDLQPQVEIIWGTSFDLKQKYMKELNICETTYEKMENWIEDKFKTKEFAYPQLFTSVELIKEFYSKFLSHLRNLRIIGIGLPEKFVGKFFNEENTLKRLPKNRYGIENLLMNKVLVDEGGMMQGYEILGFEDGYFHSYLCNGLEKDYKLHFNFTLNENGFINSLSEAEQFCNYTNIQELGEPVLWLPWAIFEYNTK